MKKTIPTLLSLIALAASAVAGDRHFTNVYETTTAAKGSFELETWATWEATRGNGEGNSNVWKFRHEIEYGITDRLQLGIYVANWTLTDDAEKQNSSRFESASAELIYRMTDPTTDPLGSALYLEVEAGPEVFALEGKLLLQKNVGSWIFAFNSVLEAEWEGHGYEERVGNLEETLGVAYQITPKFYVGAEAKYEVGFDDWSESGENVFFAGPNVSFHFNRGYVTLASLFQCTSVDDEPRVQTRLIFGITF